MLKESRNKNYERILSNIVRDAEKKGYDEIKADHDDFEKPSRITAKDRNIDFAPDVTAAKEGQKDYYEISNRSDDTPELINKWKLLSMLASMKNGKFYIYVPHGHMKFTRELCTRYNIDSELVKI